MPILEPKEEINTCTMWMLFFSVAEYTMSGLSRITQCNLLHLPIHGQVHCIFMEDMKGLSSETILARSTSHFYVGETTALILALVAIVFSGAEPFVQFW